MRDYLFADADRTGVGSLIMDQGQSLITSGTRITTGTIQTGLSVGNSCIVNLTTASPKGNIIIRSISIDSADGNGGNISHTSQGGNIIIEFGNSRANCCLFKQLLTIA